MSMVLSPSSLWSLVREAPGNSHILPLAGGQGLPRVRLEEGRAFENSTHVLLCNHAVVSEGGSRTPCPLSRACLRQPLPCLIYGPLEEG